MDVVFISSILESWKAFRDILLYLCIGKNIILLFQTYLSFINILRNWGDREKHCLHFFFKPTLNLSQKSLGSLQSHKTAINQLNQSFENVLTQGNCQIGSRADTASLTKNAFLSFQCLRCSQVIFLGADFQLLSVLTCKINLSNTWFSPNDWG